jgi:aarF domain-containing kinase
VILLRKKKLIMVPRTVSALLLLASLLTPTEAFVVSQLKRGNHVGPTSEIALNMVSTSTPPSSSRRKKSVQDRTQDEAISLVKDVVQAVYEAGPRAGPARTLQAYMAVTTTIRDFLPQPGRSTAETFSLPVALRKLFERLGATYIKLGQFVASSPTLFPKEYVLEFQKCLDATEPLEWSVIKRVIETELGPISNTFSAIDQKPLASASIAQVSNRLCSKFIAMHFKRLICVLCRFMLPH